VMRAYLRHHRPWWKHPRWHVHHWSIQVHFIQNLKRWLFSRCASCGERFSWGYAPVTPKWEGTGPLWFKSETKIYHHKCLARIHCDTTDELADTAALCNDWEVDSE